MHVYYQDFSNQKYLLMHCYSGKSFSTDIFRKPFLQMWGLQWIRAIDRHKEGCKQNGAGGEGEGWMILFLFSCWTSVCSNLKPCNFKLSNSSLSALQFGTFKWWDQGPSSFQECTLQYHADKFVLAVSPSGKA